MGRTKIDYGIDLGTTNSAISRMDNGEINLIDKEDTNSDTIPSCVAINPKGSTFVGVKALNHFHKAAKQAFKKRKVSNQNSFLEFKRTMGASNQHESDHAGKSFSSEELSAEVLKKLKGYVRDDQLNAAVITVPARFRQNQIDATQTAAELAGFDHCELLQEPIAASMAYGLEVGEIQGKWLVFDFGGGTFDTVLLQVDDGIMKIVDTAGDNHLGGKNLNDAIIDQILIPYLEDEYDLQETLSDDKLRNVLRQALKELAEQAKIELATKDRTEVYADAMMYDLGEDDSGEEIIIDTTITLEDFEEVVGPLLQRSIDIANDLLAENNISGSDLETIIPVGGTTYLQSLRDMIRDQISESLDISQNPMTAVTKGAALFASTKDIPEEHLVRDKTKLQLKLKYPETTVEEKEKVGIRVLRDEAEDDIPDKLFVEIRRTDGGWGSGKKEIEDDAIILDILLNEGKSNGFDVTVLDEKGNAFATEPDSFTIINGLKNPNATLSYPICIAAYEEEKEKSLLKALDGLGKNQSLPAKGKGTFKILNTDLSPGNPDDVVNIEIYEGEPNTKKEYNELANRVRITGEDIPQYIPEDSEVDITIEIDSSRRMKLKAYFPYIDETVETEQLDFQTEEPDASELEVMISKAKQKLKANKNNYSSLNTEKVNKLESELNRISKLLEDGKEDTDTKVTVLENIREISIELDKLEEKAEWPQVESELKECLDNLRQNQQQYGNEETRKAVQELEEKAKSIIEDQNAKRAKDLIDQVRSLDFKLIGQDIGFWVAMVKNFDDEFDMHDWKDRSKARNLINQAKRVISTQPSLDKVRNIVLRLFELLPNTQQPAVPQDPTSDLGV